MAASKCIAEGIIIQESNPDIKGTQIFIVLTEGVAIRNYRN